MFMKYLENNAWLTHPSSVCLYLAQRQLLPSSIARNPYMYGHICHRKNHLNILSLLLMILPTLTRHSPVRIPHRYPNGVLLSQRMVRDGQRDLVVGTLGVGGDSDGDLEQRLGEDWGEGVRLLPWQGIGAGEVRDERMEKKQPIAWKSNFFTLKCTEPILLVGYDSDGATVSSCRVWMKNFTCALLTFTICDILTHGLNRIDSIFISTSFNLFSGCLA